MCDTCPCDVSSIPGPVDVAARAARNKLGRRVAFWTLAMPMFLGIIVYTLGWWLVPLTVGPVVVIGAGTWAVMRVLQRHAVVAAPASLRAALPAPRPIRAVVLPRGLSISGKRRQALPAPARALPAAVVTGRVIEEPAIGWENVPAAYRRQVFGQPPPPVVPARRRRDVR